MRYATLSIPISTQNVLLRNEYYREIFRSKVARSLWRACAAFQERTDGIATLKIFAQLDGHVKLMSRITHDTLAIEFIRDILIENYNFIA